MAEGAEQETWPFTVSTQGPGTTLTLSKKQWILKSENSESRAMFSPSATWEIQKNSYPKQEGTDLKPGGSHSRKKKELINTGKQNW